jgi:hypothetical protein
MSAFVWSLVLVFAVNSGYGGDAYLQTKPSEQDISKLKDDSYQQVLQQLKEPRLPGVESDSKKEVYRILILPTWGNAVSVRVERHGENYNLAARRLSGNAGFELGKLVEERNIELSGEDSKRLEDLIQNLKFPGMPTDDGVLGFDGDSWILEGISNGKYHVVRRWCAASVHPETRKLGAFLALVKFMVDKSTLSQRPSNKGQKLI